MADLMPAGVEPLGPTPLGGSQALEMLPQGGPGLGLLPEAATQIAAGMGQGTLGLIKFPGDVASGRYSLGQISHLAPQEALGLAALGMGIPKPPGSLEIFGGARAAEGLGTKVGSRFNHETDALAEAQRLEDEMINSPSHVADIESPTPEEHYEIGKKVFDQTGWYRGADSKWRFVISDEDAAFGENTIYHDASAYPIAVPSTGSKLEGILDHPDLYEAYPFLKDYKVESLPLGGSVKGQFDAQNKTISVQPGQPVDVMSTLLHEVQHAVQEHEGFARGGSPMEFINEGQPAGAALINYHRLAGEVESRLVQRLYEGGYEGEYPPSVEHWDVPRNQQILRFYNPAQYRLEPVEGDPFNAQAGNGSPGGGQGGP